MLLYVLGLCYRDDDHISSSPMISSHPIALFLKKKLAIYHRLIRSFALCCFHAFVLSIFLLFTIVLLRKKKDEEKGKKKPQTERLS